MNEIILGRKPRPSQRILDNFYNLDAPNPSYLMLFDQIKTNKIFSEAQMALLHSNL